MNDNESFKKNSNKLGLAIIINLLLTILQVIGGILSGSLSLIADGVHNLSDAGAILVAQIARKIARRPADKKMTYGYQRAEILGSLINSTTLVIVGVYLIYEAVNKYFNPSSIDGWIVIWIAGVALIIDIATALLTHSSGAKNNINLRAAFIHNISDALASLVVIIAGTLIVLYQLYIVDVLATVGISAYVIYHGIILMRKGTLILMQSVPDGFDMDKLKVRLEEIEGVITADHIHVWQLDDKSAFFEGHILTNSTSSGKKIREKIKSILGSDFKINHSTIEIEETSHPRTT